MAKVTYIGPCAEVAVPTAHGDVIVARGDSVDLPDELVHGTPAEGDPPSLDNGFSSPGYRSPTAGLLAQAKNWKLTDKPAAKKSPPRKKTAQPTTTASDTEES